MKSGKRAKLPFVSIAILLAVPILVFSLTGSWSELGSEGNDWGILVAGVILGVAWLPIVIVCTIVAAVGLMAKKRNDTRMVNAAYNTIFGLSVLSLCAVIAWWGWGLVS